MRPGVQMKTDETPTILSQLTSVSSTDASSVCCPSEIGAVTDRNSPPDPDAGSVASPPRRRAIHAASGSAALASARGGGGRRSRVTFPERRSSSLAAMRRASRVRATTTKRPLLKGADVASSKARMTSQGQRQNDRSEATDAERVYNFELSPDSQRRLLAKRLDRRRKVGGRHLNELFLFLS